MEEGAEESYSYDENLLDSRSRNNMLKLTDIIKSFPKKDSSECLFCQESMEIHNLHDVFRVYSAAISCLVYHTKSVEKANLLVFFEAEVFVLKNIQSREPCKVSEVLEYHRGTKDIYEEALKDQLIAIFKTYFTEKSIKINCEQEIESITYKYYKLMDGDLKKSLTTRDLELILTLLFKRNEFIRFFRIFENNRKTYAVFKLALLLSTNPECHISTKMLLKESEELKFEKDGFFEGGEIIEGLRDISETVGDPEVDIDDWISQLQREAYWADCVKVWAANREYDTGAVDNSMIELCIKNKHYEEGWLIYKKEPSGTNININKICILCFNGLRETQDKRWINRIIEVVERAATNENPESSCIVADSVLTKISEIPESNRNQILKKFVEIIHRVDNNEEVVNSLLRGFLLLCSKCKDPETCSLCADYANQVYKRWKKFKKEGFLFFKRRSQCDTQIYSNMLGVCDAVKDCEGFYNVCKDLMNANTNLNRDLCIKLENFHNQNCQDCNLRKTQVITSKKGKVLIFHFLNKS